MTYLKRLTLAVPLSLMLSLQPACSSSDEPTANDGTSGTSQDGRVPLGKADALSGRCSADGKSHCGEKSAGNCWCDDSCTKFGDCCGDYKAACTNPSCPDPNADGVQYINDSHLNPLACTAVLFSCGSGQTLFSNECGCGCQDEVNASCPAPGDPTVHYVFESEGHPEYCYAAQAGGKKLLFKCESGQTPFVNGCGCGCIDNPAPTCPDPNDPKVHYVANSNENPAACLVTLFTCDPGQELFSNACGCGCVDAASSCPDPKDPKVHYANGSDKNPAACLNALFKCSSSQSLFYNDCGCGCIDPQQP